MEYAFRFNGKDIVIDDVLFNVELHCDEVHIELINTSLVLEIGLKLIRVLRGCHMPTIFDIERNSMLVIKLMTGNDEHPVINLQLDDSEIRLYNPEVLNESE